MKNKHKPDGFKERVIWFVEFVSNVIAEHQARIGDMDAKLDHLVKRLGPAPNGNH